MSITKSFEITDDAKSVQAEIEDDMAEFLDELAEKHEGSAFKAAIVANLLVGSGIALLIDLGVSKTDLADMLAQMIEIGDSDTRLVFLPTSVADDVSKPEGKPS